MIAARAFVVWLALALAIAIVPATAKDTLVAPYYLKPGTVDLRVLLAPPPEIDSSQQQYDEKKIEQVLASRTAVDMAQVSADAHRSIFAFTDVLGSGFAAERVPLTTALFRNVGSDTETLIAQAKVYFARPRPAGAAQTHGSYPSGHAAFASCAAILLGQMVPEKRLPIFARASVFAESRIVAGVHYPSDVEAGWISGTVIAAALLREPRFVKDFSAAKAEVRRALGLPDLP